MKHIIFHGIQDFNVKLYRWGTSQSSTTTKMDIQMSKISEPMLVVVLSQMLYKLHSQNNVGGFSLRALEANTEVILWKSYT